MAGNTPFKYFKQIVHRGCIQDPLIVHWPAGIEAKGEIRGQYHHIIDIGPTIMEVLGLKPLEEIDGISHNRISSLDPGIEVASEDPADKRSEGRLASALKQLDQLRDLAGALRKLDTRGPDPGAGQG